MNAVTTIAAAALVSIAACGFASATADARQCRVEVSRRVDHWVGRHWTGSETYGQCVEWFPDPPPEPYHNSTKFVAPKALAPGP
jgi:hypothetical protein